MAITEISSVAPPANGTEVKSNNALGKDDFLHLLVTQLQNQDPMNPMESAEFSAQLAQFSSLEQLTNINGDMDLLVEQQSAANNTQAVSFIGKDVTAKGNTLEIIDGDGGEFSVELAETPVDATVFIYDGNRHVVKTFTLDENKAGMQSITWDATDQDGNEVADGLYRFEVVARSPDERRIDCIHYFSARVTGVTFENGSAALMAGERKIPMDKVVQVEGHAGPSSKDVEPVVTVTTDDDEGGEDSLAV